MDEVPNFNFYAINQTFINRFHFFKGDTLMVVPFSLEENISSLITANKQIFEYHYSYIREKSQTHRRIVFFFRL